MNTKLLLQKCQSKAQSIKRVLQYMIILYITTVSDAYYSFHFISIFNAENPKQCFFYKQELKKKKKKVQASIMHYSLSKLIYNNSSYILHIA